MKPRPKDPLAVSARARSLSEQGGTQYWIVVSYADGMALLDGVVPDAVKAQFLQHLHPAKGEGRAEYLARLGESETIPSHVRTTKGGLVMEP